ncbi:hypothetical protein AB0M39_34620 [Streptomyces sp. NPDC051907]|uniref:hypothetical protein n=1 Tax=Streptomyces sp. NPDC051907 TaxID=3155284 RepID=UPI003448382B
MNPSLKTAPAVSARRRIEDDMRHALTLTAEELTAFTARYGDTIAELAAPHPDPDSVYKVLADYADYADDTYERLVEEAEARTAESVHPHIVD